METGGFSSDPDYTLVCEEPHCPIAEGEVDARLIEPVGVVNTATLVEP